MARVVVTSAADLGGHFGARPDRGIIGIGRMIGRRTMAVLALHAGKVRSFGLADKSRWQIESHRVAGQTRTVGLAPVGLEPRVGKRGRMEGMYLPCSEWVHGIPRRPETRRIWAVGPET